MRPLLLRLLPLFLLGGALLLSCAQKPDDPRFDNPFDPDGEGGDPFQLTATLVGNRVQLQWIDRQEFSIPNYVVWRDSSGLPNAVGLPLDGLAISRNNGVAVAFDDDYLPNRPNYYRVQAIDDRGQGSDLLHPASAVIVPPPRVELTGGALNTATRFVQLDLRSDSGDQVELAEQADFSDGVRFDVVAGQTSTVDWTLPQVSGNDVDVVLQVRGLNGGVPGVAGEVTIDVEFTPTFDAGPNSIALADTAIALQIDSVGVERMRFMLIDPDSAANADLSAVAWKPGAGIEAFSWPVAIDVPWSIAAEFDGDFGFTSTAAITLTPALTVGDATMTAEGGAEVTTNQTVELVNVASGAGFMRISEDPGFVGTTWVAFADTIQFDLSPGAGDKSIFGQFANPWDPQGSVAAAHIVLLGDGS